VFAAARGRAVSLGLSRQLIGDAAFGASGYRYCGNVLASSGDEVLNDRVAGAAAALASLMAHEFGLVGVNGIDCVIRDGIPYAIEVNPRWCASMELVERHYGQSMFGVHAAACREGTLPEFDLLRARRGHQAIGKAIVFARDDMTMGDTRSWLSDGSIRDVPKPGERIAAGQPICTIFAAAADAAACRLTLSQRAIGLVNLQTNA
jgi:predicted ATP-grasp superfamily ATP-dependent carboligase